MKCISQPKFIALTLVVLWALQKPTFAAVRDDSFDSIPSNWVHTGPGKVALSPIAHSGKTGLELAASSTHPWQSDMTLNLGAEHSGRVSIYVHGLRCCTSAGLAIQTSSGDWTNIQLLPHSTPSVGNSTGNNFQSRVSVGGVQTSKFFSGSNDTFWNRFEITANFAGVVVKLNDNVVMTDARITSFSKISLTVWGAPSGAAVYDDFSVVITPVITDGFEEPSVGPFWSKSGPGSAATTKSAAAEGAQSLQTTTSTILPWNVDLGHDFGAEHSGSVSVLVKGSALCCGASAGLQVQNGRGDWALLQQLDSGMFQARFSIGGQQTSKFVSGSSEWHQFTIVVDPDRGGVIQLDGVTVLTNPALQSLRSVGLSTWGGPSASAFFDAFRVVF